MAGAIIIIQLDKKEQAKSLISLGFFTLNDLRKIYFNTSFLIVAFGVVSGLVLGTIVCIIQLQTGVFKASETLLPCKIILQNYIYVSLIGLFFGISVSWIFSKISKKALLRKVLISMLIIILNLFPFLLPKIMKITKLLVVGLLFSFANIFAQIPTGYYDGTDGLSGAALKSKLSQIITNGHQTKSYDNLYNGYRFY